MKLVSFDIFDTTLIRQCGLPKNIFYLLAKQLFGKDTARSNYFLHWRIIAEAKARNTIGKKHLTLEQIYQSFESDYFNISVKDAIDAELKIESENLQVNPAVREIIKSHRTSGAKICFISDMYLSKDFLFNILYRENCIEIGEEIFVSCEHNASKDDGSLYDIVKSLMGPSKWIHYGDNKYSDIKKAKHKGIIANVIDTDFTPVEHNILNKYELSNDNYIASIIVGYQRSARIMLGNSPDTIFASNFIAPLYISYIHHVFDVAKQEGIKKLYFLNRDSYILYRIAQALNNNSDFHLNYLFVSRRSLALASLNNLNQDNLLSIFDKGSLIRKKLSEIFSFLKFTKEEQIELSYKFDFNKVTSIEQQNKVLEILLNSDFTPILKSRIKEHYNLVQAYLKQEGFNETEKSACVDVGWYGTSRMMINRILKEEDCICTDFFYLGVREDVLPMKYGKFNFFIAQSLIGLTSTIENYFSLSPYQSVVEYTLKEDIIVPVFKTSTDINGDNVRKALLDNNISICEYMVSLFNQYIPIDSLTRDIAINNCGALLNNNIHIDYSPFLKVSSFEEFSGDSTPFVKKLSYLELFCYLFLRKHYTLHDDYSFYITIKNYAIYRNVLTIRKRLRSILKKCYNFVRH